MTWLSFLTIMFKQIDFFIIINLLFIQTVIKSIININFCNNSHATCIQARNLV